MNNVRLRRLALSFASICAVISGILLMMCSFYIPNTGRSYMPDVKSAELTNISFPCAVSGTKLLIRNIASYDGVFYEDGSNEQVFNTAAVVIENPSDETVMYAQIELKASNQVYVFEAMMLPPGSATLVPEKNRQQITNEVFYYCSGWAVSSNSENEHNLKIHSTGNGTVAVQNLCSCILYDIKLYHKTYLTDSLLFIGGTATETRIRILLPGQTVEIHPTYYAEGYSKFVFIS